MRHREKHFAGSGSALQRREFRMIARTGSSAWTRGLDARSADVMFGICEVVIENLLVGYGNTRSAGYLKREILENERQRQEGSGVQDRGKTQLFCREPARANRKILEVIAGDQSQNFGIAREERTQTRPPRSAKKIARRQELRNARSHRWRARRRMRLSGRLQKVLGFEQRISRGLTAIENHDTFPRRKIR